MSGSKMRDGRSGGVQPLRDPESLRQMARALDRVWDALPEIHRSDGTRRQLALLIVRLFDRGEHDPARLAEMILSELFPGRGNAKIV